VVEHATDDELERGLDWVRRSPDDHGRLALIARRPSVDARQTLTEAVLDETCGLVGDSWLARHGGDAPTVDRQVTVMNARVAALVARRPDRRTLAGDQLYVDLDLSHQNLAAGDRLRIGSAVLEVSDEPHLGCQKFATRFGGAALRFVNSPGGRARRLRGLNATVVSPGTVRVGDAVVVERARAPHPGGRPA